LSAPAIKTLTPRQEALKLTLKQVSLPWAIYIRVSTKDQGEKYSPASQRETLQRLAADLGVYVPENFILIDKKTGKTDDRPDYQRLMQLAKDTAIGGVLALELSRVGRNVVDAINFRKMLKREGSALAFAMQQFDDSPQGILMFNQFAAFAEYEAALIIQRTNKGRLQKAKEGKLISDPHTFGYLYHPATRLPGGKLRDGYCEAHPVEAEILRVQIFAAYVRHGSAYQVQKDLNAAGILTKRGNPWTIHAVCTVLRNRIYTGVYVTTIKGEDLKPVEITIRAEAGRGAPALISQALFDKAQVLLAKAADRAGRPPTESLLSRLIRCTCILPSGPPCLRLWVGHKASMRCTNKRDDGSGGKFCPSRQVAKSVIEPLVFNAVRDRIRQPETVYSLAREFHAATNSAKPEAVSIETRLARLKARYERTEAIVFADVPQRTRDKAAQQLKEIEQEQRALEVEASEADVVALPSRDRIMDTCERIGKGLDRLKTFDEKRTFVLQTVDRVETDGYDYAVYCRIELAPAGAASGGGKNSLVHVGPAEYFSFVIRGKVA